MMLLAGKITSYYYYMEIISMYIKAAQQVWLLLCSSYTGEDNFLKIK